MKEPKITGLLILGIGWKEDYKFEQIHERFIKQIINDKEYIVWNMDNIAGIRYELEE